MTKTEPQWCCNSCGTTFGRWYASESYAGPPPYNVTYHLGQCDVCGRQEVGVTSPKHFGYLTSAWRKETRYARGRV